MFLVPENVNLKKDALIGDDGVRISYAQLEADAARFAESIRQRCFVIILADNSVDTIRFYLSCMTQRCVPLLLEPNLYPDYLEDYVKRYLPRYLWAPEAWLPTVEPWGSVVFHAGGHVLVQTAHAIYPMDANLALLLTTSGSTGNPKAVRLSRRNLEENATAIVEAMRILPDDRSVTSLPINYTYGMAIVHMHLRAGASLLITSRKVIDPQFRAFLYRENITNFQGVPYIHEMMDRLNFYNDPPQGLRFVSMGGGKAPEAFQDKLNALFARKGIRFYALYGQTEGTTMLTKLPEGKLQNDSDCIGVACRGMEASVDPETGELIFRGTSVCMGFAETWEDLLRGDDNKGILHTGDLARMDSRGYIYLMGRLKRIVKMAGKRLSMDDVETLVCQTYPQVQCACCGADNDLAIFVTEELPERDVKYLVATRLRISHLSLSVIYLAEIPRTERGKTDYGKMQKLLEARKQ